MDGLTLVIDAASLTGSVAIARDGTLLAERVVAMRGEHEERLMPALADALRTAGGAPGDVSRVVCGAGPGSFTSLRIAASIAKGIATAVPAPLFAVSSLALMAAAAGHGRWLAALDAMRGERFVAAFSWDGATLAELLPPGVLAQEGVPALAAELNARVVGDPPRAAAAVPLLAQIVAGGPVDLALWEPQYGRLAEAQVRWEAVHGRPLRPA